MSAEVHLAAGREVAHGELVRAIPTNKSRLGIEKLSFTFCVNDKDISEYRELMTSCVRAISIRLPALTMTVIPANCPADVKLVIEIRTACQMLSPFDTAMIPNVKDTERYPSPIGIPSVNPFRNEFIPCLIKTTPRAFFPWGYFLFPYKYFFTNGISFNKLIKPNPRNIHKRRTNI